MARLKELRRTGHWEIDLVQIPSIRIKDTTLAGMLFVVDTSGGLIRMTAPIEVGEALDLHVARAASQPAQPCSPSRPRTIRCRHALRSKLSKVAKVLGARLIISSHLPAVDQAAQALSQHFAAVPALLPSDPEPWLPVLEELHSLAPWDLLPDSVIFRFPSGYDPLHSSLAVVLGQAGEQIGLAVYPTQQDYDRFMTLAHKGRVVDVGPWQVWAVHLDPLHDMEPEQREACIEQGLVVGDLGLLLMAMDEEGARPLTHDEERACLVAAQGVLGAFESQGATMLLQPTLGRVPTVAGELTVVTTPDVMTLVEEAEPPVVDASHQIMIADTAGKPSLILKMAKRDAQRLARALYGVDALSLEAFDEVVAWAGDHRIGVITRGEFGPQTWSTWRERGSGELIISAGGAKRRGLRFRDIVASFDVLLLEDADQADDPDHAMYDPDALAAASWDGPPESWPKASTVLLDFAEPLGLHAAPAEAVEQGATIAAAVWSAVVMADHGDDHGLLDDLRARASLMAPIAEIVELLIARKRATYPQDKRVMKVESCTRTAGRVGVKVAWRLP